MPSNRSGAINRPAWDARELYEAYLLIPAADILRPKNHAMLDEMHRRLWRQSITSMHGAPSSRPISR